MDAEGEGGRPDGGDNWLARAKCKEGEVVRMGVVEEGKVMAGRFGRIKIRGKASSTDRLGGDESRGNSPEASGGARGSSEASEGGRMSIGSECERGEYAGMEAE